MLIWVTQRVLFQLILVFGLISGSAMASETLNEVKNRGELRCGVSSGVAGFSGLNSQGQWVGLDVDICRAVAAAVLGDSNKVAFTPLSSQQRFAALQAKQIDVLSRNTTWTLSRDAGLGIAFTAVVYYDGQGILMPKRFGVKSATELEGAELCVQSGTTNEKTLTTYLSNLGVSAKLVVYDNFEAAYKAFFAGRCQGFSTDVSALIGLKTRQAKNPDDYVVLPEVFSKEPLGPAVKRGDERWQLIVQWVVFGLIEAEELGVTQSNVDELIVNGNAAQKKLLGQAEDIGKPLGLAPNWVANMVRQVGNYGELFDRNLGKGSALGLERGPNALWTKGGLMYAPPLR